MSNESDLEKRLCMLEETLLYQERTVEQLNQVIIEQQNQLDKLTEEFERLKEQMMAAAMEKEIRNEPPPHY